MSVNARTFEEKLDQQAVMERALLDGRTVADVVAVAAEMFKVSRMSAYRDVVQIKRRWKSEARRELDIAFGKALARRERLYRRAIVQADDAERADRPAVLLRALKLAHRIEIDRCELLGLYPKNRVVFTTNRPAPSARTISNVELSLTAGTFGEPVGRDVEGVPDDSRP